MYIILHNTTYWCVLKLIQIKFNTLLQKKCITCYDYTGLGKSVRIGYKFLTS